MDEQEKRARRSAWSRYNSDELKSSLELWAFDTGFTAGVEYQQAKLGPILAYDFDTVREAGRRLGEILVRDGTKTAVDVGAEDYPQGMRSAYVIRAVIEALFGNSDTL